MLNATSRSEHGDHTGHNYYRCYLRDFSWADESGALLDVYGDRDRLRLGAHGFGLDDSPSPHACSLQSHLRSSGRSLSVSRIRIALFSRQEVGGGRTVRMSIPLKTHVRDAILPSPSQKPVLGVHLTGFRYGSKHSLTETVVRTTARSSPDSDFGA